tara:strand:- start:151 stop:495 length:345 start_codon:yes stop_codon:yes gene_type:complete
MADTEDFARQRFDLNKQRQTLKEQQQQRLTVTHNGGLFKVDMTIIVYLKQAIMDAGLFNGPTKLILIDSYDNPIEVDIEVLVGQCVERWAEVSNDWYNEYQELKSKRRAGDIEV